PRVDRLAAGDPDPLRRGQNRLTFPVPAVECQGLTRKYGDRVALDGVSLSVEKGRIFGLLGPNGGGKTTLFRILATLLPATSGRFTIEGLAPEADLRALRRRLGVVFQSPSLDAKLTVLENLLFGGAMYGLSGPSLRRRAEDLLGTLGVLDRAKDQVGVLSGGLARRVEIAKALLHAPSVLLLDEPSTGLDPGARRDLRELLSGLSRRDGTTVLLTTHLFEEAEACDELALLDRGKLIASGTPASLKATVGGDVLVVEAREAGEAPALASEIASRFDGAAGALTTVGETVRLELPRAHEFLPSLVEAFPGRFRSVSFGAPTLEDVFIAKTGRAFREAEGSDA
ncbi:MAG TPA: ABC transporter ATP-binding protein, partial [Thermoanaerobaculia bacterium]|nr:ABC transporter ATP-binding protein [Thermoanaerobaculia bacterium]